MSADTKQNIRIGITVILLIFGGAFLLPPIMYAFGKWGEYWLTTPVNP